MVLAPVEPLDRLLRRVACERPAVKSAHEILRGAAAEEASGIDVDDHDPLGLPLRRCQLEEIRTLELARLDAVPLAPCAHVFPLLEILRRVEAHLLVGRHYHDPFALRPVPEDLGVAEILDAVERSQHRIAFILRKGQAVVQAVCEALGLNKLPFSIVRRIEGDDSTLSESSSIVIVDHGTAGEDVAVAVAVQRDGLMLPVDQVRACRVTPVHVAPDAGERIVLIIEVIHSVLVEQAVRVVHPAVRRRVMIDGTVPLSRDLRRSVGKAYQLPDLSGLDAREMHVALRRTEMLQVQGHAIIGQFPFPGQAYVRDVQRLATLFYRQCDFVISLLYGNDHIPARSAPVA